MSRNNTVVITGATGYVGSHLTAALTAANNNVHCLVRPESKSADVEFLRSCGAHIYTANLDDAASMSQALSGAGVVVHLIGSIAPRRGQKFEDLHAGQIKQLIERCRENHIDKVVLVTALGTAAAAHSQYHVSKWQAEECLKASGLEYIILRPSLLVGRQVGIRDSKLVLRLMELIKFKKVVPLVGGGNNKIQPLFIGDLIDTLLAVIKSDEHNRQELNLAGPDIITMRDLALELMKVLNIYKPIMNLSPALAGVVAHLCEWMQSVPILSRDQVKLSLHDNTGSAAVLQSVIKREPVHLSTALCSYSQVADSKSNSKVVV
jgi:uncharacterized protein YbjT (DUF2867 family)